MVQAPQSKGRANRFALDFSDSCAASDGINWVGLGRNSPAGPAWTAKTAGPLNPEGGVMDRLAAMEMFVKVVSERSFSGAARTLGVSKSVVSKAVAELEDRLGAQLLNRTTRQMSLTEVGQAYHDRCMSILESVDEVEQLVSAQARAPKGLLRLTAPVTFSITYLGGPVSQFLAANPELSVEMQLNDRVVDIVEEGFDLALRISRRLRDSNLIAVKLCTSRTIISASPAYLERHGTPSHPRELFNHSCLRYSNLGPAQEWTFLDPATGAPIQVAVTGRIITNNGEILRSSAVNGEGIISGPSFIVADDIRSGRLVPILKEFSGPPFGIYAVYPPNRHVSAKVRRLVDHLRKAWGDSPEWEKACGY
jgi:DNA-binding transcriptional LysR family regulator